MHKEYKQRDSPDSRTVISTTQSWDVLIERWPGTGWFSAFTHTIQPEFLTMSCMETCISSQLTIQCFVSTVVDTTLHNNYTHRHLRHSVCSNEVQLTQCIPWKQNWVGARAAELLLHSFLNLALDGGDLSASHPAALLPGGKTLSLIEQEAGWASDPVCYPTMNQNPDHPTHQLVSMSTEI